MKKQMRTVALMAVLILAAVGCQKEEAEILNLKTASSEVIAAYTVSYSIDGVAGQVTLYGDEAHEAFIYRLLSLAEQGHEVFFCEGDSISMDATTREVVTFTTGDKKEAGDWSIRMEKEGYRVKVTYDEKTGLFTCIARR